MLCVYDWALLPRRCRFYRLIMDIRDAKWQRTAFREREHRLVLRLATTIGTVRRDGQYHAWNNNLELVVAVAR